MEAARESVTAQFANAASVEFSEMKMSGTEFFPDSVVCGIADSEELTRASRFIFVPPDPDVAADAPEGRRWPPRPGLRMDRPPRIDGSDREDEHYWEALSSNMPEFETKWAELCAAAY